MSDRDESQSGIGAKVPRVGVVLFSNPKDLNSSTGWFCASGDECSWFTRLVDLPQDVLWILDADYDEYQVVAKKHHNLRRGDFFRSSLRQIAADLGVRLGGDHSMVAARELAKIAQTSVSVAASVYGWKNPVVDLSAELLRNCIGKSLPKPPKSKTQHLSALTSAHQSYSSPSWTGMSMLMDSVTVTLRFNRVEYAKRILSVKVPDEGWTYISDPAQIAAIPMEEFLRRPCMVKALVELNGEDAELATLAAFGCSASKKPVMRQWISQPELAWLSKIARIQVQEAMFSNSERELPDDAQLPRVLTADPFFMHSMSAGIVAESHWNSLLEATYNTTLKQSEVTAWGVWLRAHDRAMSFALAQAAMRSGFRVNGYGSGAISVRVPRNELVKLMEFADDHGLAHPCFRPIFVENGLMQIER